VNRQEELELATPERQMAVAKSIVAAVENFCAARAQPQPVAAQPAQRPAPTAAVAARPKHGALLH
jgi:hypothetical protein